MSSDSDFARLAARLREQGATVYGFGERKTPRPFITACDKFVYFDVLSAGTAKAVVGTVAAVKPMPASEPKPEVKTPALDKAALNMLATAVAASADENGRANLGQVGSHLAKQAPDFDARNYGFGRLSDLAEASGILDVERSGDQTTVVMVKLKAKSSPPA